METETRQEQTAGEQLRAKYGVKSSEELALRVARKSGLISIGCGSANMGKVYISPKNSNSGLCDKWRIEDANKNYWIANRILWSRGLTFGGKNWHNGEVSDLGNRLRILDGCHSAEEGWLSGWHEDEDKKKDARCDDGVSAWNRSYACRIMRRAHGYNKDFREGFDYNPEYFGRLVQWSKKDASRVEREFREKINKAIANRFFEESVGTMRKIEPEERRKLAEIYAEVNLGRSPAQLDEAMQIRDIINNHLGSLMPYTKTGRISECLEVAGFGEQKWQPKSLTQKQWEAYKRVNLNPNPSILDRVYSYFHSKR
ncbi:MAG: hypothetical protein AABX17_02840 [Nanoarchaeota archaeon]